VIRFAKLAVMDTAALPQEIYAERLAARKRRLDACIGRRDRTAWLRLAVFFAGAVSIWYAFHGASVWWIAGPVAIFIALVAWQSRIERAAECARRAILFYERGIARLQHRWQGAGESGERFIDPHHPYTSDLDLFGRASIFELISTARTRGGEARLAAWLRSASSIEELRQRHEAIDELRPLIDLREQIAILGDDFRTGVNPEQLARWASEPADPFASWMRVVALCFSVTAIGMLLWWVATDLVGINARRGLILTGLAEALLWIGIRMRIVRIVHAVEEPAHDLDLLSQILATLEQQRFHSPRLAALRAAIELHGGSASHQIARLRRWTEMLDSRENFFLRIFGPLLLWTTQLGMAVEAWRAENGPHVAAWLNAVSEIEALSSLANYAWEHPSDPFPEFAEQGCIFDGDELGHPLLAEDRLVRNSVSLAPPLRLLIVSGSNMSGKSTLLRTIGVNAVLALAGAPVRAQRLLISHLSIGASIRTIDSLEEGHSRFMAEILRLKQTLELPPPMLFLLDELLHGTNSHDRALGSEGVIRALLDRGGIGLVTTHDLSLARVADELAPAAANVHFEDRLEKGRLVFDYRMRPGIVARSNALDLMRAVGLDV
jgi:hypothetical protein